MQCSIRYDHIERQCHKYCADCASFQISFVFSVVVFFLDVASGISSLSKIKIIIALDCDETHLRWKIAKTSDLIKSLTLFYAIKVPQINMMNMRVNHFVDKIISLQNHQMNERTKWARSAICIWSIELMCFFSSSSSSLAYGWVVHSCHSLCWLLDCKCHLNGVIRWNSFHFMCDLHRNASDQRFQSKQILMLVKKFYVPSIRCTTLYNKNWGLYFVFLAPQTTQYNNASLRVNGLWS